ncbi:hypothetical protein EYR41_002870 [Orbilia oligospora]|uniref:Uncharacterized protein n=1 Tax=Orbilia oligospora TaxID=2813651 RepID=A0A7C8PMS7_ORBOL|nr:hypothetical protein TWF751_004762 [Orbilia oligospora]TGJ70852.1 hypothetical protein EYR41_002870 [Orbilia oligospora]
MFFSQSNPSGLLALVPPVRNVNVNMLTSNVSINLLYKHQHKIPASSESLLPSACLPAVSLDEMSPIGELDVNIFCSCTSTLRLDSDHDSFEAPEAASSHSCSSKLPIAVRHR